MNYKIINSFRQVKIIPKTLVLCDIDETVLKYNGINAKWWMGRIAHHYNLSNNMLKADRDTYLEWREIIHRAIPSHTDINGFNIMIDSLYTMKGELVFVTARQPYMENLTRNHLEKVLGDHYISKAFKLWLCGDISKGEIIDKNIGDTSDYNRVVFIDDNEKHLLNVYKVFGNTIDYYMFDMDRPNEIVDREL
jgi:hypothetical protein